MSITLCSVRGCVNKPVGRGWCNRHYLRWKKYGRPDEPFPTYPETCTIYGCHKPNVGLGYCSGHYQKLKKYGDPKYEKIERHGMRHSSEYEIWKSMRKRCNNPNYKEFYLYGGRGIKISRSWDRFTQFYKDMGSRPSKEHSIERIDTNKGYSKANCKWATYVEQNNNKRNNRLITINGKTQTLAQWCREADVKYSKVLDRLKRGCTPEKALEL